MKKLLILSVSVLLLLSCTNDNTVCNCTEVTDGYYIDEYGGRLGRRTLIHHVKDIDYTYSCDDNWKIIDMYSDEYINTTTRIICE